MPTHPLTTDWSAPITLQAGDIIQNQSAWLIELIAQEPGADAARLRVPAHVGTIQVDGATTVRARCVHGSATLHVVRGF